MTKKFCDLCKKEMSGVEDSFKLTLAEETTEIPWVLQEICQKCYTEIREFIDSIQKC